MPRDTNGNYTLPLPDVIGGNPIEADNWANPTLADIANVLQDSLSRTGQGGMQVPFQNVDGAVGTPGITFTNEPTMGVYRAAAGDMRVTIGGLDIARWTSVGLELWDGSQWNLVAPGGGNYYGQLSTNTSLAPDTDYALIQNVVPGVYAYRGWAHLNRQFTGYVSNLFLGIGPATANPVSSTVDSSKVAQGWQVVTPNLQESGFTSMRQAVSLNEATSFNSYPVIVFVPDIGSNFGDSVYCEGIVTVDGTGDLSWRMAPGQQTTGWDTINAGSYISLVKVG